MLYFSLSGTNTPVSSVIYVLVSFVFLVLCVCASGGIDPHTSPLKYTVTILFQNRHSSASVCLFRRRVTIFRRHFFAGMNCDSLYASSICGNSNRNSNSSISSSMFLIHLFLLSSSSVYFLFSNSYDFVVNNISSFLS